MKGKITMYLIEYQYDYADEFYVHGFEIVSKEELDEINKKIENSVYPIEQYFGTNEAIEWDDPDDVKEGMIVKEITQEEADILIKIFGKGFAFSPEYDEHFNETTEEI